MNAINRIATLALVFFFSTAVLAEPDWINGGGLDGYRDARFLTATGEGQSREDARKHAISQLAEQLKVSISSQSDINKRYQSGDSGGSSQESMNIRINTRVDLEGLEGIKIVEQYFRPSNNTYYAFAVLDKNLNANNLSFSIESRFEQIRAAIKQAKSQFSSGKASEGLRLLIKASRQFSDIDREINLHRLFANPGVNSMLKSDRTSLAQEFDRYLGSVLASVRAEAVGDSTRSGSPELGVRDPFVARFSYRGSALTAVPVRVSAEDAGTVINADRQTDARGEVQLRVRSFPYTGKAQNKLVVKLDLDETTLNTQSPRVDFFIQLSQKSEVNILLKSKISNRFNDFLYLTVNDGLTSILSEQNYHVVTEDQGYAGNTDYMVQVQANATALPGYSGIHFVKFTGVVSIRSNKTGRTLKAIRINSEATKAGALSVEAAAEKAAQKLADAVRTDLLQTLESNLGRE